MTKGERALRLRVAYEIISGVQSDLSRGTRAERDLALEFSEPIRLLVLLSDKVQKAPKNELLKKFHSKEADS